MLHRIFLLHLSTNIRTRKTKTKLLEETLLLLKLLLKVKSTRWHPAKDSLLKKNQNPKVNIQKAVSWKLNNSILNIYI